MNDNGLFVWKKNRNRNGEVVYNFFATFAEAWQEGVLKSSATYDELTMQDLRDRNTVNGVLDEEMFNEELERFGVDESYTGRLLEYNYFEAMDMICCKEGSKDWEDEKDFLSNVIFKDEYIGDIVYREDNETAQDFAKRVADSAIGIIEEQILFAMGIY